MFSLSGTTIADWGGFLGQDPLGDESHLLDLENTDMSEILLHSGIYDPLEYI